VGKRMDVLWKTCGELDRRETETAAISGTRLDSIPSRSSSKPEGTSAPLLAFVWHEQLLFGAAALIGTLLLFTGWLADYQRQAAVDRLEKWEAPPRYRALRGKGADKNKIGGRQSNQIAARGELVWPKVISRKGSPAAAFESL